MSKQILPTSTIKNTLQQQGDYAYWYWTPNNVSSIHEYLVSIDWVEMIWHREKNSRSDVASTTFSSELTPSPTLHYSFRYLEQIYNNRTKIATSNQPNLPCHYVNCLNSTWVFRSWSWNPIGYRFYDKNWGNVCAWRYFWDIHLFDLKKFRNTFF